MIIIPDDVWVKIARSHTKTVRAYMKFVATHPEQCECINPTGAAIKRHGNLIVAIEDANTAEKPKH